MYFVHMDVLTGEGGDKRSTRLHDGFGDVVLCGGKSVGTTDYLMTLRTS